MKINKESFLERMFIALIIWIILVIGSVVVTFVTFVILNVPITIYIGRFNWNFDSYVIVVLGVTLIVILVDNFRKWVD